MALEAATGNLLALLPAAGPDEVVTALLARPGLTVERIVSHGHASPPGFWYDQPLAEWVLVLAGAARIAFEGEAKERELGIGDYIEIAAHRRHRVEWTDPSQPTVWLAIHFD